MRRRSASHSAAAIGRSGFVLACGVDYDGHTLPHLPLASNHANDVATMARRKCGFDAAEAACDEHKVARPVGQPRVANLLAAVEDVAFNRLGHNSVLVVYFCGHGTPIAEASGGGAVTAVDNGFFVVDGNANGLHVRQLQAVFCEVTARRRLTNTRLIIVVDSTDAGACAGTACVCACVWLWLWMWLWMWMWLWLWLWLCVCGCGCVCACPQH